MTPWVTFFNDSVRKIFADKATVIDIGGGLRVSKEKNNRYDASREWIRPLLEKVDYKIMDPVPDYHPDIVGDIHALPFADNSQDAIICLSVLEHVENPIKAWQEMHRVLKPGGYCFIYVPFLYYYHADKGYYGDFWRFTKDTIQLLSKPYASSDIVAVGGAIYAWIKLSPIGRLTALHPLWHFLDAVTGKRHSEQVSGYFVFLMK